MTALYDPRTALPRGLVMTRALEDGLMATWIGNGYTPLTANQVTTICGAAPVEPTTLKRYPGDDSTDPGAVL